MMRRVFCVLSFLAALYCLSGAMHSGWLTAADPVRVGQHRLWYYVWLAAGLLGYGGFGVLLRPRSVLHFVLCSLAVPGVLVSALVVQHHGWCSWGLPLLMVSCGYLLWRLVLLMRRLNN